MATALSVYKPQGKTPYGSRQDDAAEAESKPAAGMPLWVRVSWVVAGIVAVLFVIQHLAGGGFPSHASH